MKEYELHKISKEPAATHTMMNFVFKGEKRDVVQSSDTKRSNGD